MKVFKLLVALIALAQVGCVTSDMMAVGGKTYPPRPKDYVIDVYTSTDAPVQVQKEIANLKQIESLPPGSIEIGRVDTKGAPASSWANVVDDAKEKARSLGGDALIVKRWGEPLAGMDGWGQAQYGKALSMSVIRLQP